MLDNLLVNLINCHLIMESYLKVLLSFMNMTIHSMSLCKFNLEYNSLIDIVFRKELELDFNGRYDHTISHNLNFIIF